MIRPLFLALAALPLADPARAHEFRVTFIVPADQAQQARQAFLLASSERDAHPGETSEGHLGGLDSQLEIRAPGEAPAPSDIVVATAPATLPAPAQLADVWAFRMAPTAASDLPGTPACPATGFGARFQAAYGSPPGPAAGLVYCAAQRIELAVRAAGGVADKAALARFATPPP